MRIKRSIHNADWMTPDDLEFEYGISIPLQTRLRMKKNYTSEASLKFAPIPFVKVGKLILYRRDDIDKWLETNTIKGETDEHRE